MSLPLKCKKKTQYLVWKWKHRNIATGNPTIKTTASGIRGRFPSSVHKEHTTLHKLFHVLFVTQHFMFYMGNSV